MSATGKLNVYCRSGDTVALVVGEDDILETGIRSQAHNRRDFCSGSTASEFQYLTKLFITAESTPDPHDWEWQCATHSLLNCSRHTRSWKTCLSIQKYVANMDSYIEVLVSKNPRLRYVFILITGHDYD